MVKVFSFILCLGVWTLGFSAYGSQRALKCELRGGTFLVYGYYSGECTEADTDATYGIKIEGLILGLGFSATPGQDAFLRCHNSPPGTDLSGRYDGLFNGYEFTILPLSLGVEGRKLENEMRSCTLSGPQIGLNYSVQLYAPVTIYKNN